MSSTTPAKRSCPECNGTGAIEEVRSYRQPPPGDEVFISKYRPASSSSVVEVETSRPCIRCGGSGELAVR